MEDKCTLSLSRVFHHKLILTELTSLPLPPMLSVSTTLISLTQVTEAIQTRVVTEFFSDPRSKRIFSDVPKGLDFLRGAVGALSFLLVLSSPSSPCSLRRYLP